jgi:ATP-dependent Clp protease ATP-binding subunit ClpA
MGQEFTEQARRSILHAQHEAQRLNRADVDTEHLLLGLLSEIDSGAMRLLQRAGLAPEQVREALTLSPFAATTQTTEEPHLTNGAKRVLELAAEETWRLDQGHIGTEHLLLGLLREKRGEAHKVLLSLGVQHQQLVRWVAVVGNEGSFNAEASLALHEADRQARVWQSSDIGPEHILLGVLDARRRSGQMLQRLGVAPERVELELIARLQMGSPGVSDPPLNAVSRQVIRQARKERELLGQPICGTEHLLLGVLNLPGERPQPLLQFFRWLGLPVKNVNRAAHPARQVLNDCGITYHAVRLAMLDEAGVPVEGDWKTAFTQLAQRAVEAAHEAAWQTGCGEIAPSHLLIGLLQAPQVATHWQTLLQIEMHPWPHVLGAVRAATPSDHAVGTARPRFSQEARRVLKRASSLARQHGHRYVAPEYLLLALLETKPQTVPALQPLHDLKLDINALCEHLPTPTVRKQPIPHAPDHPYPAYVHKAAFALSWICWMPCFLQSIARPLGLLFLKELDFRGLFATPILALIVSCFALRGRSEPVKALAWSFINGFLWYIVFFVIALFYMVVT